MAGNYPDLPAPRVEYDRDGTRVYRIAGATVTELTAGYMTAMNDENPGTELDYNFGGSYDTMAVLWVFPELRDITHAFMQVNRNGITDGASIQKLEWSNDSTTGVDGTWTVAVADFPETINTATRYRSDIIPVSGLTGVRMIKMTATNPYFTRVPTVHFYGKSAAGQSLHRLRLWHPTLDAPLDNYPAHLDWGNVPQGSTDTKQFRVKNDSPNLGASGIKVFLEALYASNPTQVSQHTLSLDGTTFSASAKPGVTIASLAAQDISNPIHLRRTTVVTAQLGLWRQRIVAAADTWA